MQLQLRALAYRGTQGGRLEQGGAHHTLRLSADDYA